MLDNPTTSTLLQRILGSSQALVCDFLSSWDEVPTLWLSNYIVPTTYASRSLQHFLLCKSSSCSPELVNHRRPYPNSQVFDYLQYANIEGKAWEMLLRQRGRNVKHGGGPDYYNSHFALTYMQHPKQQVILILPDTLCDQISQAFPLCICYCQNWRPTVALGGILILPL